MALGDSEAELTSRRRTLKTNCLPLNKIFTFFCLKSLSPFSLSLSIRERDSSSFDSRQPTLESFDLLSL